MEKIHIRSIINSNMDGSSSLETDGEYNREENIINYIDNDINVTIMIEKNIIIRRKSSEYALELIFDESIETISKYKIFNPESEFDVKINTSLLKRNINGFYIKYSLYINNEKTGDFSFEFEWED